MALMSWPRPGTTAEATIAFLYEDQGLLSLDYERSALWSPVSGARSVAHSLYLEKTESGQAWFNFGRRNYFSRMRCRSGISKSRTVVAEPEEQRISVPILSGGKNRRKVAKNTRAATTLWVIFSVFDGNDPSGEPRAMKYLEAGCLGAAPGTVPIPLSGISILGRFNRTRKEDLTTTDLCCG